MWYGYARVSGKDQCEDRQIIALTEYGVPPGNIFTEKQSGKDFEREKYKSLIEILKANDILVIKSIDRLGRNYKEIIKQWQFITQDIGADIVILDMPLLDTRFRKDLIGTLISDIILQLLSYVAENERLNIRQRQAEGIEAAKARGVKFGRPKQFIADNYIEIYRQYRHREITRDKAIQLIGCGGCTFYRMLRQLRKSGKVS